MPIELVVAGWREQPADEGEPPGLRISRKIAVALELKHGTGLAFDWPFGHLHVGVPVEVTGHDRTVRPVQCLGDPLLILALRMRRSPRFTGPPGSVRVGHRRAPCCTKHSGRSIAIGGAPIDLAVAHHDVSAMTKAADLLPRARDRDTVVVAELPDGRQLKMTGYERAAIWARRPELAPLQVNVIVVHVADAAEAARLYDEFEQLLDRDMM